MAKVMIFIDGSWLYNNLPLLSRKHGESYRLDYGKLPGVLGRAIGGALGRSDVDIVRTYLFGSLPRNYALIDDHMVERQKDFYNLLREEYHYEVEIYPIAYHKRRIRKADRDPDDPFVPEEKFVDIALASSMLYYAAIPSAYDIAVAVTGDRDFVPMLQHVRRLGKRVAVASIRESCAKEYKDANDPHRLKDFDIIWLGDHLEELELKPERKRLACQSPFHEGDLYVDTSDYLRKGRKFYCEACKAKFKREKEEQTRQMIAAAAQPEDGDEEGEGLSELRCKGEIKKMFYDRGFGFIRGRKGDYYFHCSEVVGDTDFDQLAAGMKVAFDADNDPDPSHPEGKSGKASNVQVCGDEEELEIRQNRRLLE